MKKELLGKVEKWISEHKQEMLQMLSEFVQVNSVLDMSTAGEGKPYGQGCRDMLDLIRQKAECYGLYCSDVDGYALEIRNRPESDNEIGIFNHGDDVAVGGEWAFPPFCGRIDGDFVLGRGAHDNKCGCVMSLFLLRMFNELGIEMKNGLRLVIGTKEETGMQDMEYYTAHRKMPGTSLVPDCVYPVNFGQKGGLLGTVSAEIGDEVIELSAGVAGAASVPDRAEALVRFPAEEVASLAEGLEDITVKAEGENTHIYASGIATHTANPWKGKSAILALMRLMVKLPFVDEKTAKLIKGIFIFTSDYYGEPMGMQGEDDTGRNTVVMSRIEKSGNKLTMRVVNKACLSTPVTEFIDCFEKWCTQYGITIDPSAERRRHVFFDREDPRVKALQKVYKEMTGKDDPPYCMGGCTYSKVLPETITFGIIRSFRRPDYIPAGTGDCHSPNEYIDIEVPMEGIRIYTAALLELDPIV